MVPDHRFSTPLMLIGTHHGRGRRLDLVTAFLGAVNGAVTDAFCGYQMKFLNIVQNLALFQAFILRVVPSITGFAWRRNHRILLSGPGPYHLLKLIKRGTR
jgi:hypothetical protein